MTSTLAVPLRRYLAVLAGLWAVALAVALVEALVFHLDSKYWYPLYSMDATFLDFSYFGPIDREFHQAAFFHQPGFSYPAPLAFVFGFFYLFGEVDTPLKVFLGCTSFVFVASAVVLARALSRHGWLRRDAALVIGMTCALAYPAMFLFERGNIEVACWLLAALGVTAYWKQRWILAGALFGIAASLKLFPGILLALLLSRRQYRAFAVGVATAVGVTAVSLWALGPTFPEAWRGIGDGLAAFRSTNLLQFRGREVGFDHSLFGFVRLWFHAAHPEATAEESIRDLQPWLTAYLATGAVAGLGLYFWKIRALPRANQLLALTAASLLLPPMSSEYTLVLLYVPFAALLLWMGRTGKAEAHGLTYVLVCFAILFAPESYLWLGTQRVAGQFRAIMLVGLLAGSLRYKFGEECGNVPMVAQGPHEGRFIPRMSGR